MSEREYIVSLNAGVDYNAFNAEMVADIGKGDIPYRSVDVANARPASKRNTHYNLTDAEAETLRKDSRVYGVTLLPELDPDLAIGFSAIQSGDFTKTTSDSGDFLNWGMRRINEETNPYSGLTTTGGYNYTLDGTGVDIVIQDSGIQADHPEFTDTGGASRVQQIDWTTESGIVGMPAQSADYYRDYDGHGTHVAGTAAGKTYGWAKNAKIYSLKVSGLEGSGDSGTGTSATYAFDCIKEWHKNKPVDPTTGAKRPTVVNMSWGYLRFYDTVTSMTYRGDSKTGTDIDSTSKRWAFGLPPSNNGVRYMTNTRIASVDVDMEELIEAGVHVVVAAGNRSHKVDVLGGDDYDNLLVANTGSVNYQRGSSPFSTNAHIVGNVDSVIHSGGLEQKAESSEAGPGVSVFAPGTDIMSAVSTTNRFTDGDYPSNSSFKITNISGTSMAAPQIAGVLGLWLQLTPEATPAQGLQFIKSKAKASQLYDSGSDNDYTDTRSLLGSTAGFAFNKFNSATQLTMGTISDAVAGANPTYALTSNLTNVNEGSSVTISLATTNIANGTDVAYVISGVTTDDISESLTGNFTVTDNAATLTINVTADATTEGAETMVVTLVGIGTSVSVTINDTSLTPAVPTYTATPAANDVNEGSTLTVNVATTNVADATTLYWTVSQPNDFAVSSGSFVINSNAGSFTVSPGQDIITEGAETFTASVRLISTAGTIVATTTDITINDTSQNPAGTVYDVTVASGTNQYGTGNKYYIGGFVGPSPVLNLIEGSTYTFKQNDLSNATHQLLFSTTPNGTHAGGTEFTTGVTKVGTAGSLGAYTKIIVPTSTPTLYYYCINHPGMGGTANTPDPNAPTYDSIDAPANANEGDVVTFTVNTQNVGDATTIGYTITGITNADLSVGSLTGNITISSNTGAVAVTLAQDSTTEGSETMTLTLDATDSGGNSTGALTAQTVIADTSTTPGGESYALSASSTSITEGENTTFTLTTTSVADATNVPYTITGVSSADLDNGPRRKTAAKDFEGPGSAFFKREMQVGGVRLVIAGGVGGQTAVPDLFADKVARMFELFTDSAGAGINAGKQNQMIETLLGNTTSYHSNYPTIQRIARGAGGDYTPNFLTDAGISAWGLSPLFDSTVNNDMVWYLNSSGTPGTGDEDAQEVIEHVFHTLHMHGLDALSLKMYPSLSSDWATGPLYNAMVEAYDAGKWDPSGYNSPANAFKTNGDAFEVAAKEYLYLLNFCMFDYSTLWDGNSLAPEWTDDMRTPAGIQSNNPLGYALFNSYIGDVISKPSLTTIRSIFQDGDTGNPALGGASGYVADAAIPLTGNFTVSSDSATLTLNVAKDGVVDVDSLTVTLDNGEANQAVTVADDGVVPGFAPDYALYVTNPGGNQYTLSGYDRNGLVSGAQPTLAYNNGDKVIITVQGTTSSSHPFYIKTVQGGGTGNQASGVDGQGTVKLEWTIGSTGTFYYQCSIHSGMNNTITVS